MSVNHIDRLTKVASAELSNMSLTQYSLAKMNIPDELLDLLAKKNGFYAFESALHVLPSNSSVANLHGIISWNDRDLWKAECGASSDTLFFAEDVFGGQFGINSIGVVKFDLELLKEQFIAPTIDEWCQCILSDFKLHTGYNAAHEWQKQHGGLPTGYRLVPKIPFILGGSYDAGNLVQIETVEAIKCRCDIARQIRELPNGTKVRLIVR